MNKDKTLRFDVLYTFESLLVSDIFPENKDVYNYSHPTYNYVLSAKYSSPYYIQYIYYRFNLQNWGPNEYNSDNVTQYRIEKNTEVPQVVQLDEVVKDLKKLVIKDRKNLKYNSQHIGLYFPDLFHNNPMDITNTFKMTLPIKKAFEIIMNRNIKNFKTDMMLFKNLYLEPIF